MLALYDFTLTYFPKDRKVVVGIIPKVLLNQFYNYLTLETNDRCSSILK